MQQTEPSLASPGMVGSSREHHRRCTQNKKIEMELGAMLEIILFFWYSSLAMGASYILESGNFCREVPLTDADFGLPKTHYLLHMQTLTFRLF